jgi:tRNA (guanine26-N2/guanine27-N2)-dimethyltransferase
VLCGADRAACLKHYGATPLNNEFAHENAVRLLAAKVVLTAAPFNFSAQPLLSFSHLHYVKLLFRMEKSAASALNSVKSLGFVSYCEKCCFRKAGRVADEGGCPECGNPLRWGGPFYLGDLWDGKLLERMLKLNAERAYSRKGEIGKVLLTMLSESRINACGYYDLHVLARRMKAPIRSMDAALERLRNGGFLASRTHFCPTAVRTDAPHGAVLGLLG